MLVDNSQKRSKEKNWFTIARQLDYFEVSISNEEIEKIVAKSADIVVRVIG